jgi:hypothetical protein
MTKDKEVLELNRDLKRLRKKCDNKKHAVRAGKGGKQVKESYKAVKAERKKAKEALDSKLCKMSPEYKVLYDKRQALKEQAKAMEANRKPPKDERTKEVRTDTDKAKKGAAKS